MKNIFAAALLGLALVACKKDSDDPDRARTMRVEWVVEGSQPVHLTINQRASQVGPVTRVLKEEAASVGGTYEITGRPDALYGEARVEFNTTPTPGQKVHLLVKQDGNVLHDVWAGNPITSAGGQVNPRVAQALISPDRAH